MNKLTCSVNVDSITLEISQYFDYEFSGKSIFIPPEFNPPDNEFGIGLIVGPSGSGKSTLLNRFGDEKLIIWDDCKAIVSHFKTADEARKKLGAVGLNSVPSWVKPYYVLSTGEKFRANLARRLQSNCVIDEFTSVVDRNVAKSCSVAMRRYVDNQNLKNIVLASCHYDIIDWLQPDWVFDTVSGNFSRRGAERRPSIKLDIQSCKPDKWSAFAMHHYLTSSINNSAKCFLVLWNETPVAFASALAFPNGNFKNAWREHRTVVLPDYQGLGIGVSVSNTIANLFVSSGFRYFSKTAHPRFGEYRNSSPLWRPTSKNNKPRKDYASGSTKTKEDGHKMKHINRVCYSHEFIGNKNAS